MPQTRSQRKAQQQAADGLLALPEALLVAVLQCLAAPADQRSLFSAAHAHSRLRQAAAAALGSIAVTGVEQQRLDGVLRYLRKHGQHVRSLSLAVAEDAALELLGLPATLQLHSLELEGSQRWPFKSECPKVQLLPGNGHQGVLGQAGAGVAALTQLRLRSCKLLDGEEGLAAALAQLPGLQHLSIRGVRNSSGQPVAPLAEIALQQGLQQLTHLELFGLAAGADQASPDLQPLQALSRLVDLRLGTTVGVLTASMLSGAAGLTRLELSGFSFEPRVLAGKAQLQHLRVRFSNLSQDAAWVPTLLSQLQSLQQLTHLAFSNALGPLGAQWGTAPPAAFSALTASSKLQHLDVSKCTLPAGLWQHVFPASRQLPHLTVLAASDLRQPSGDPIAAPEGSLLASCCPGLQALSVRGLSHTAGALTPLQGLSGLRTLVVGTDTSEVVRDVCQLTGLRRLQLYAFCDEELLLQTTQLRQLTCLSYRGKLDGRTVHIPWVAQAPQAGDEPVWRQVLRRHLNHRDRAVRRMAAAALRAE